jgi:Holliday junction resolvase RusA-like endonuclease
MDPISFTIPGPPVSTAQQKGAFAPRAGRVLFFTKANVKAESGRLFVHAYNHRPKTKGPVFSGPVVLELNYVFPMTQAQIGEHMDKLNDDSFVLYKTSRPDVDNAAKLLIDVMTKATWWQDDAQITDLILRKRCGCVPRIEVTIREGQLDPSLGRGLVPGMLA